MTRTRIIFISIIAAAILIVAVSLLLNRGGNSTDAGFTLERPEAVTIRVLTALPVEPWVRNGGTL
ncbi:MAG: hypothetical protein R2932_10430 [Caldilineaceae bacterium]